MSFFNEIEHIAKQYKEIISDSTTAEKCRMPGNAYFIENGSILALPRDDGDSRYPYGKNGFNFWAYASGYMHSNEGLLTLFLKASEGQEPRIAFFAGIPDGQGSFEPVPLLGVPVIKNVHADHVHRYTVFSRACAYYITEVNDLSFTVRVFPDEHNYLNFSIGIVNKGLQDADIYLSAYINPFLVHNFSENVENRWFREVRYDRNNGSDALGPFIFKINEDLSRTISISNYGVVHRSLELRGGSELVGQEVTTSRYQYVGGVKGSLHYPAALYKGTFGNSRDVCAFTDIGVAGDLIHLKLPTTASVRYDAEFSYAVNCSDEAEKNRLLSRKIITADIDRKAAHLEAAEAISSKALSFKVKGSLCEKVKDEVFNPFAEHLKKQVEFCSLVKGYVQSWAGSLIGIRDIFQSLEGLIYWKPEAARDKILEALNFVFVDGRCPRQYSLPRNEGSAPAMDLRPFIDQGVWVISTIYSYIKVTGNFSFLNRECGYYVIEDEKKGLVRKSDERNSVLDHMIRIMGYLLSNRDYEKTGCIRALYGDWNDALDGLGVSSRPGVDYGTGVSVMATLQVYQNLREMSDLLGKINEAKYAMYVSEYTQTYAQMKESLLKYAIVQGDNDEKRILHGWGDQRSYFVGSFDDPDHLSRHGLTSNAFWVLSGMYEEDVSIKETILNAFSALDSQYGFKTFEPHFSPDTKGVGRIPKLPAGTAENGASYIHATAFAAMALYKMGYPKEAWEQIVKILPLTHTKLSHSPFVMPNSYVYNEVLSMDGESMGDWQTGSSNVLIKTLIRYVFGLECELDGVWLQPPNWVPFKEFEFESNVKGCRIMIKYANHGGSERKFRVNGVPRTGIYNAIMGLKRLWIPQEELKDGKISIDIED